MRKVVRKLPKGAARPAPARPDRVDDQTRIEVMPPEGKRLISLRIDPDVLRFFQSGGRGYQTRINAVLRAYMQDSIGQ